MDERRSEPRLLCADLVEVVWKDKSGKSRRAVANLEDISSSGACLQLDVAIPLHTNVKVNYTAGELTGSVRYCVYREIGYFVGIQFGKGMKWSQKEFRPLHLFDPRRLASKTPGPTSNSGPN
ncbi:MAG: PilZ domain-containing protein [Acidimicrobiia bacterium]|nr:PilZ domain-containing protein [Acidimicrobiia bacterium]